MATIPLPPDFSEFLKLCDQHDVRYLLVGGYAVAYHGHPRTTGDMDVFVERSSDNAARLVAVFRDFGFLEAEITPELFLEPGAIVRIGVPPLRLEVFNEISGVTFEECFARAVETKQGQIRIRVIALRELLKNKHASGRKKDLADIDELNRLYPTG
ncbi:MAG: nucleotidyltransferase [Candidatus Saccharimonas sp.]|nr:nucleotidyltransferase [Planctomycetaceae bacterium]